MRDKIRRLCTVNERWLKIRKGRATEWRKTNVDETHLGSSRTWRGREEIGGDGDGRGERR